MNIHVNRSWSWADWFMVGIRLFNFSMVIITYIFGDEIYAGNRGIALSLALLAFAIPQLFYLPGHIRPKWFLMFDLILGVGFTLYLLNYIPYTNARSYLFITAFVMSYMFTQRSFYWLAPITIIITTFGLSLYVETPVATTINYAVNLMMFSVFGFSFGMFIKQKTQLSSMLKIIEEKNIALEHSIKQVERLTLLEERNRMARELHDTVGHSLTASIVAMEAVQLLIDRDPEASKQRLNQLITFSRNHLDDFRRTVHDMSMDEIKQPVAELLSKAVKEFSDHTGTKVNLEIDDDIKEITSEAIKLCLLRCLQESITNAKKHGNATEINITLKQRNDILSMQVYDNGKGTDELAEGFGIEGLRARLEALRGTLRVTSKAGEGTTVFCDIPIGV